VWASRPDSRVFDEAKPAFKEHGHARIRDAVVDLLAVAARGDDSEAAQSAQLVRDRLRFHACQIAERRYMLLARSRDLVEKADPGRIRQTLVEPRERHDLTAR
jgi:hypothetical protein